MPCHDHQAAAENEQNPKLVPELRKSNDLLARIACRATTALEILNTHPVAKAVLEDPELREWWEKHRKFYQQLKEG